MERIEAVPGVGAAAVTSLLPLSGRDEEIPLYVDGRPRPTSQGDMSWALLYATDPGYLDRRPPFRWRSWASSAT